MENKGSKFFKRGSAFLIAPALFSSFLPGTSASTVGGAVASKAASESVHSKPGSETLSFFKNHWGESLVVFAFIVLMTWALWPIKSEESEGSGTETGNVINAKQNLKKVVESSSEDEDDDKDDDQEKEDTLEDVLKIFSGEKFSKWITKKSVGKDEGAFEFSSTWKSGVGRLSLFKLVVNKTKEGSEGLHHEATFSCIGSDEDECETIIDKIYYLDDKDGVNKLKSICNKIFRFLTVFDKVVSLCADNGIEPTEEYMGNSVKNFTFNLKPAAAKGFSLKLGTALNDPWRLEEIQISNKGEVRLKYVDVNGSAQYFNWYCFSKYKPNDLKFFENAFSEENKNFKGWVKKEEKDEGGNFDVKKEVQKCIQDIKNLRDVECKSEGGDKLHVFQKQVQLENGLKSFYFSTLGLKDSNLKYRLCGKKGAKEINLNSKDAAKQVKELFSKLKSYSDGIDCIVGFCKENGISVIDGDDGPFKFSGGEFAYFYFNIDNSGSEFFQVSVASDGYVRFHKNGWQWCDSGANTKLDLYDKDDVAKLKGMLDGLKKKEDKNSDMGDGSSSDEKD